MADILGANIHTLGVMVCASLTYILSVPCEDFFEPNWESGKHVRWRIGMADRSPFAIAGLWRAWQNADGSTLHSFTQLTVNADDHPLMKHFHRPGSEKRSLVIVPREDYDAWLTCRDPEVARSFMRQYPADQMGAEPAPKTSVKAKVADEPLLI